MKTDGTIVLTLRAEPAAGGAAVGDAQITYAPSHPEYAKILKHVSPIEKGQTKPVQPFSDP